MPGVSGYIGIELKVQAHIHSIVGNVFSSRSIRIGGFYSANHLDIMTSALT